MAITDLGLLGTGSSKAAATTLAVVNTTGAIIPAGTLIHITGCWDNTTSTTAPTITCSTVGGGTAIANHATAIGSGVTTTAGSGVWHQCFRVLTTASIASGATIATLTSNQSAVTRAAHAEGWTGVTTTLRGTVATGTSTTGSPSVATAGTALVAGDLVIGSVSFENAAQMTRDSDTLNGSWDTIVGEFTTGNPAASNTGTGTQDKVVTATGVQTYNPTGGVADTVACVYSLVPQPEPTVTQAAYRFYADGTETGTLVDTYAETNVDEFRAPTIASYLTGQSFLGNGGSLVRAGFWLNKIGVPSGNMWAEIRAHTGPYGTSGVGTGTVLATSATRVQSTLQTTAQWEDFTFDGTFTLANGTPYVVVLATDTWVSGNTYQMGDDGSSATHSGNRVIYNGTTWSPAAQDVVFRVYTDGGLAVALAAQDTAYTADLTAGDVNLLLRTRLQETAGSPLLAATDDWQLQWEKNASGLWSPVSTSNEKLADGYDESHWAGTWVAPANQPAVMGQTFLGNGGALIRAGFFLAKLGAPTGNIRAEIYAHTGTYGAGGTGTGSPLATSATRLYSSLQPTARWEDFTFDGSFVLAAGTPYAVVIAADTYVAGNAYEQSRDTPSPTHSGNATNWDATWFGPTNADAIFRVFTTPSAVVAFNSANLTDAAATTNRLGAGTGSFVAGKVSEDGLVDDLGWTGNNYTEVLYALTLKQADLANADTLRFRVLRNGVTTGLTYTATPTVNVTKSGAALPPRNIHLPNPMISPSFIR